MWGCISSELTLVSFFETWQLFLQQIRHTELLSMALYPRQNSIVEFASYLLCPRFDITDSQCDIVVWRCEIWIFHFNSEFTFYLFMSSILRYSFSMRHCSFTIRNLNSSFQIPVCTDLIFYVRDSTLLEFFNSPAWQSHYAFSIRRTSFHMRLLILFQLPAVSTLCIPYYNVFNAPSGMRESEKSRVLATKIIFNNAKATYQGIEWIFSPTTRFNSCCEQLCMFCFHDETTTMSLRGLCLSNRIL